MKKPFTKKSVLETASLTSALAVLSANKPADLGFAACRFASEINEQGISERVMVMPDGHFNSHDGRPFDVPANAWLLDQAAFELLKSTASTRTNDYHFDYEHQTLHAEENGKPAPASGWFNPSDLEYVPGEGLYALNVRWTPSARAHLKNDEYRFISPVFHYDKQTGRPTKLRHFALTNDPAVDGMDKVAVLKASKTHVNNGENTMNAAQKLLSLLGVTVDGDNVTDADYTQATTALTALKAKADEADTLTTELSNANDAVAALKANSPTEVNLAKYVPVETYNALHTEMVALKSTSDNQTVEQEINKAKQDGRVITSEEEYLTSLGNQQGVAALKAVLDARSPIASLTAQQTTNTPKPEQNKDGLAALTAEDKYAADQLGLSHAAYAKAKQEQN
ncbi:Mu-like prophage I [Pseudoalteromonas distincta]|uniref:phage protease n=1 Tax=Pseudoalteromonas distincta TaxID=77608 RepID=UPI00020A0A49|nr:phage protease [Pseudoalteromonas distincta]EGI72973.1 Mu-like prophage I [Pseudoalteromonas distincta]